MKKKTILEKLIKNYPGIPLETNGTPKNMCPEDLGYAIVYGCDGDNDCPNCWSRTEEEAMKPNN